MGCLPVCLGERLNGIQEVIGSIPTVSTKNRQLSYGSCRFLLFHYSLFTKSTSRFLEAINNIKNIFG